METGRRKEQLYIPLRSPSDNSLFLPLSLSQSKKDYPDPLLELTDV